MKKTILVTSMLALFFEALLCVDFEKSAKLLMPLNQLEAKINSVATETGISDWDERFDRFKKHLEVLKENSFFKTAMNDIRDNGFEDREGHYPNSNTLLILSVLGFKPIGSGVDSAMTLVNDGILSEMRSIFVPGGKCVASKPTIPFSVVIKSYPKTMWEKGIYGKPKYDAQEQVENFVSGSDEITWIENQAALCDPGGSGGNLGSQNISALFLGFQPIICGFHFYPEKAKELLLFLHFYLKLIDTSSTAGKEGAFWKKKNIGKSITDWPSFYCVDSLMVPFNPLCSVFELAQYQALPSETKKKYQAWSVEQKDFLTFIGNLYNYRFLLYAGFRMYNDNSRYITLVSFLCEFFFRSAFGDQVYLKLLIERVQKRFFLASGYMVWAVENLYLGDGFSDPGKTINELTIFKTWNEFENARTGPAKETLTAEQKNSYPPIIPTFKEFLKRVFGPEGEVWTWDDANPDKPLAFVEAKKDEMLARFLEHVEGGLAVKLQVLSNELQSLRAKLEKLKGKLESLKGALGVAT